MSVYRYKPVGYDVGMGATDDGPYVRFSDYADLQRQLVEVRDLLDRKVNEKIAEVQARKAAEAERDRLAADVSEFMTRLGPRWFLDQGWFPASQQEGNKP